MNTLHHANYPSQATVQNHYSGGAGCNVTLSCGICQGALAGSYTAVWRVVDTAGLRIVDTTDQRFTLQSVTGHDYSLTIRGLQLTDSASYHCEVHVQFPSSNLYTVVGDPVQVDVHGKFWSYIHG